mgnify:FL=1|tara:strand:+ start:203 stop:556 length:354 start_codon:yes stop_codon:yes gene_type:complete
MSTNELALERHHSIKATSFEPISLFKYTNKQQRHNALRAFLSNHRTSLASPTFTMAYRNTSLRGQAVSTEGLNILQLNEMGEFVKFTELPVELQDKVWEQFVLEEVRGIPSRDVHIQ